jgi:hypothetical protein
MGWRCGRTLASASLLGMVLWSLGDRQQARQLQSAPPSPATTESDQSRSGRRDEAERDDGQTALVPAAVSTRLTPRGIGSAGGRPTNRWRPLRRATASSSASVTVGTMRSAGAGWWAGEASCDHVHRSIPLSRSRPWCRCVHAGPGRSYSVQSCRDRTGGRRGRGCAPGQLGHRGQGVIKARSAQLIRVGKRLAGVGRVGGARRGS